MGSRQSETTNGKRDAALEHARRDAEHVVDEHAVNDASLVPHARHAAPTRRTLLFPTSDVMRRPLPLGMDREDGQPSPISSEPLPLLEPRSVHDMHETVDPVASALDDDAPPSRASERSTVPTQLSNGVASDSSARMIELSASELESERELPFVSFDTRTTIPPILQKRGEPTAQAITARPPPPEEASPPTSAERSSRRGTAVGLLVSHGLLAVAVALVAGSGSPQTAKAIAREPHVALSERTPLAAPAGTPIPGPPSGGCAAAGGSRVLASRAQIGPGLDVSVLETGFGVALASATTEAVGLRVEGSGLRIAETVRVKAPSVVSHVVVEPGREDDGDERFDVRVDSDEARTVLGAGEAPAFRVVARGGAIMALLDDLRGVRVRTIWPLPHGADATAARVAAPAAAKSNLYRPPGFARLPVTDAPRVAHAHTPAVEVMRAAGRDDGGAVVALRRPSTLWLGVADATLAPAGPLVALVRKGATVGMPAVAPWGGGGVVAWAERAAGERDWSIVVSGFTPDGEGATVLGPVRVIGKGMSPTIATLPDGEVLLAYADGPPGAHRVVARRLDRELAPRGEPLVISPESINAGQPVAAVRPDGRALVAFFAADRGRAASVFATPLACDPGL